MVGCDEPRLTRTLSETGACALAEEMKFGAIPKRHSGIPGHSARRSSRRGDRETSPRVLERLLEETQEPSSSSSPIGGTIVLPDIDEPSTSHASRRRGSGRNRRGSGDRGSPVSGGAPFFHNAARELKLHLRSLGQQNSLDISGPLSSYSDRLPGSTSRGSIPGTFRPREDSLVTETDLGTAGGVNR